MFKTGISFFRHEVCTSTNIITNLIHLKLILISFIYPPLSDSIYQSLFIICNSIAVLCHHLFIKLKRYPSLPPPTPLISRIINECKLSASSPSLSSLKPVLVSVFKIKSDMVQVWLRTKVLYSVSKSSSFWGNFISSYKQFQKSLCKSKAWFILPVNANAMQILTSQIRNKLFQKSWAVDIHSEDRNVTSNSLRTKP